MHFTIALRRTEKNSLCVGSGAGAGGRQYITVNLDYLWLLRGPVAVPKTVKFSLARACAMDYSNKVHPPKAP